MLEQNFQVPGSSVTGFGIFSKMGEDTILAFRESSSIRSVTGFVLVADAVINNNQVRVSQDQETIIQYRLFNFAIGNKYEYSSTLSQNQYSIPLLDTNSSRACIQFDGIESGLPAREESVNAILITVIAIGCTVVAVLFITGAIAMWAHLCCTGRVIREEIITNMEQNPSYSSK